MFYRAAIVAAGLAAVSCSRPASNGAPQRIAILRFENLSGDPSAEWMGRGFEEVLARELAAVPSRYAIPPARLHNLDAAFGKRPAAAPGISAERSLALASAANLLGYGEYWLRNGRVDARLTLEDSTSKMRVLSASAADLLSAASALAHQISSQATPYATHNVTAVKAFVLGLESSDPARSAERYEEAIVADPDFGPPYDLLAQTKIQQQDRAGALAVLSGALGHAGRMPELERAQLAFEAATVRGDNALRRQALVAWSRATPNDPAVWRAAGEFSMSRHDYAQSVEAFRKAVAIEPDDAALLNQLGYAAAYAGDLDTGVRTLQHYAALRPGDANPLDSLGDVNLLLGHLREAENFYLQAAKKDPAFLGGGDFMKAAMARLMTGDTTGAGALAKEYLDGRAASHDPLADYYRAEWFWTAGRRKEGYESLMSYARAAEGGPLRQTASEAYSELAVWSVALGNRSAAASLAEKAAMLAGPASAGAAMAARFLAQPPASASEWSARAERAFPQPSQKSVKDFALACALLADREFPAASELLKRMYETGSAAGDESVPVLLAWAYLEAGHAQEAAGLLRFNPLPPRPGVHPLAVFSFPRLFYLRGRIAALAGDQQQAHAQYRLFLDLSGDQPLIWGEEAQAR